jgi:hypothetical protein
MEVVLASGRTGQFDLVVNHEKIVGRGGNWLSRRFGAGYPDPEDVVDLLMKHLAGTTTTS